MYYLYVLQSIETEDRFYIGYTKDFRARVKAHNRGKSKSTRNSQWRLIYYEAYLTDSGARKREYRLKHNGKAKYQLLKRIKDSLE